MKREVQAAGLILLSFLSGMVLTAATSGCDAQRTQAQSSAGQSIPQ
jgi:hypothetical protein